MLVTYYDAYSVLTKVYGNGAYIKQALSSTIIEEKNRSATTKICYGVLDKDITLTYTNTTYEKEVELIARAKALTENVEEYLWDPRKF